MNCCRCRSKMDYMSERSNPRAKKLCFYCPKCKAFRFTFEFQSKDILTIMLDSINPADILPSEFAKEEKPVSQKQISPHVTSGDIIETPTLQASGISQR